MHAQVIWKQPKKLTGPLAVLGIVALFAHSIKWSHSASITPVFQGTFGYDLVAATSGELSLLTYNVAGLPEIISSAPSRRVASMKAISTRINAYDIVNVQEDFYYHRELYNGGNMHRYRTREKTGIPFGDGLNVLSKYPVLKADRVPWTDCHGADCFAAKGFLYTRLEIAQDIFVDVYNIHATAADNEQAAQARNNNLLQLGRYIQKYSDKQAVIVMGDFNAHYAAHWDELPLFYEPLGLQDAWVVLQKQGVTPAVIEDFTPSEKLTLTDTCESIDKIFFRGSSEIEFTPRSYKVENRQFQNGQGQALSDHCAVSLNLGWRKSQLSKKLSTAQL
ncbi:PROBABLE EXPORTED PROTEIN [Sphingobacterium sp. JB170]|nr:PROBABLE EXPORTED PROTEIN [Sphingobacterium sp. JB170]